MCTICWIVNIYIESLTDAYSQYFVNDIEHTENNEWHVQKKNLNNLLSVSAWSSLSYLMVSAERTA